MGPLVGGAFVAEMVATELDVRFAFAERRASAEGVTYAVPNALRDHLRGQTVAIVDDAINAVGALLILGDTALPFFAAQKLAVESVARLANELWEPAACPLCAARVPLSSPSA